MSSLLKTPLPRLFLHDVPLHVGSPVPLSGADHHYLTRVLRLGPGDHVLLLDGRGQVADAQITAISAQVVQLQPQRIEAAPAVAPLPALHLLVGILKGERHDWVIEKATELGAARILSLACARSIPSLSGDRGDRRQARWARVALAAAKQCRRSLVPQISPPLAFADALSDCAEGPRLLFSEGLAPPLRRVLPADVALATQTADATETEQARPVVSLLIGPEGGLTDEEQTQAVQAGFRPCSLGPTILRAETAAIAALAATTSLLQQ